MKSLRKTHSLRTVILRDRNGRRVGAVRQIVAPDGRILSEHATLPDAIDALVAADEGAVLDLPEFGTVALRAAADDAKRAAWLAAAAVRDIERAAGMLRYAGAFRAAAMAQTAADQARTDLETLTARRADWSGNIDRATRGKD